MSRKHKNGRRSRSDNTTLLQHNRSGSTLIPPLATLPTHRKSSWINDRLPEMIWVALLVTNLTRESYLKLFHQFAAAIAKFEPANQRPYDVTLSGLANIDENTFHHFMQPLMDIAECRSAISTLTVLKNFPGKQYWQRYMTSKSDNECWNLLSKAVAMTLGHQSEEATDIRWFRVICMIVGDKVKLPTEDLVREYLDYPNYGDQRKVKPSIRATELAFSMIGSSENKWPQRFWEQCFTETACISSPNTSTKESTIVGTTVERLTEVYQALVLHAQDTSATTAIDPKHDTVIGIGLYGLANLAELLQVGASQSISGRIGLRTLAEALITLAYLMHKNSIEIWQSYRVYGAGQAKLQYLKLDELDHETLYVHMNTLIDLANEDIWEEFLQIELGHWENSNLRTMSIQAGIKDVYDEFYAWTSTFAHSHWGAIRDSVFTICGNPLHRLHRIPRELPRRLPDVVPDACRLVDRILELVSQCYPTFSGRVSIQTDTLTGLKSS